MSRRSLFAKPVGPYQLPDWAGLTDADWMPAFEEAMAEQRTALDLIASDSTPAGIDLIAEWERSENYLRAVRDAFWTLKDAETSPRLDQIEAAVAPRLASHHDAIHLDRHLHQRLVDLQERIDAGEVQADGQDRWWLAERLRRFDRSGINLNTADQARLASINQQIARCEIELSALIIKGRTAAAVHLTKSAHLDGLSQVQRDQARRAAKERGLQGWVIELVNTTRQPILAALNHRDTRQRVYEASIGRGQSGTWDTRPAILELAGLRHLKAHLLGFDHYAAYVAANGCAQSTPAVMALLTKAAAAVKAATQREAAALQTLLDQLVPGATLQPWDWAWLANQERQARFALDEAALTPYLAFETVLERGVFAAAHCLYGLIIEPRPGIAGYTEDCRTYEVCDADTSPLGLILLDPYARAVKQGGAWMTSLTEQSHLTGQRPVVTNNCNLPKPAERQPTLMRWDDVITLFHEFGHALHALLADTRYPSLTGTNTPMDYVELPSQVNERCAWEPRAIGKYARHYETGAPLPDQAVTTLAAARHHGQGFDTQELVAAMVLDQAWHQAALEELPIDSSGFDQFEQAALAKFGLDNPLIPPRYRSCYFAHIWGYNYAAGYYGYLWAEVLDADTVAWFNEHGGLNRQNGETFRRQVLALGGSQDVMAAYRHFRGADPDPRHLFERRGLV